MTTKETLLAKSGITSKGYWLNGSYAGGACQFAIFQDGTLANLDGATHQITHIKTRVVFFVPVSFAEIEAILKNHCAFYDEELVEIVPTMVAQLRQLPVKSLEESATIDGGIAN